MTVQTERVGYRNKVENVQTMTLGSGRYPTYTIDEPLVKKPFL